ncbi:MAG: hypothetical protein M3R17_00370, partial [Bacteroidota bacterium]|nr:hypothetical protein [Bacteroidota bacterium]
RLERIGIDADDIKITPAGNRLQMTISEISNYPSDINPAIRRIVFENGKMELWETYNVQEIMHPLMNALGYYSPSDSNSAWIRFTKMIDVSRNLQIAAESCELGYVNLKDTMNINRLMDTALASKILPPGFRYKWSNALLMNNQMFCSVILLKAARNSKATIENPEFDKVEIEDANDENEQLTFYMSGVDADSWRRMTKENISRQIAIIVDGTAYTWPTVLGEITGGVFTITGPHKPGDYEKLKAILETAPFPVPVRIVEETVMP